MEKLWQDIRYGFRMLRKSPMFTIVALLSLAIGIGSNTTIFTLVHTVLLRPIPMISEPENLVAIYTTDTKNGADYMPTAYLNYLDFKQNNNTLTDILGATFLRVSFDKNTEVEQINGLIVTGNYFDVLAVKPALGRFFLPIEDQNFGLYPVVVISYNFWQKQFGGDSSILGKEIILNRESFTVIGVAPEGFQGAAVLGTVDCWLPLMMHQQITHGISQEWFTDRRALQFFLVGRLKSGISLSEAEISLKTIAKRLEVEFPKTNEYRNVKVIPFSESTIAPQLRGNVVLASYLLMGAVGVVLLIACANVANLLLVRANGRKTEIAVRLCLGASRGRLFQQLIIESLLISLMGGLLGLILAGWNKDLILAISPPGFSQLDLSLNKTVLLFTFLISLLTGLIFGLVPALQMSNPNLMTELKNRIGFSNSNRGFFQIRNILVITQIALSVTALIIAGLFLRSLYNAQQINLGIDTNQLITIAFDLDYQNYDRQKGLQFIKEVEEQIEALPGVEQAVFAANWPLAPRNRFNTRNVSVVGEEIRAENQRLLIMSDRVGVGYFATMGISLVQGRDFSSIDKKDSLHVAIINEAMAEKLWPGQNPIGRKVSVYAEKSTKEIVGVVKNTKYYFTVGQDIQPIIYFPLEQIYAGDIALYIRTKSDPITLTNSIKGVIQKVDPKLPLENFQLVSSSVSQSLWAPRTSAIFLLVFAAVALLLAMMGLYGVIAYWVSQRTHEIGVRMALGAKHQDLIAMILKQAGALILTGLTIGVGVGIILAKVFSSLLYDIEVFDPIAFIVAPAILTLVAFLASYIPARRISKVDPIIALRCE
jgi:macrolide transport system ATP-binding/permease protein